MDSVQQLRVLLLGGGGMLARAIKSRARSARVEARTHTELDIRDEQALTREIREIRPDWVVNCAGVTNVEAAERDPETAYAVNAKAVGALGRIAGAYKARVLHYSTDYVFDGIKTTPYKENDATNPINVYGQSKRAGEQELLASGVEQLVIRTQWLYGVHGKSFVGLMCDRAESRQATRVVQDEFGCCTYVADLADASWRLLELARGIVHVANRGVVSRYDIARLVFRHFEASELLTACSSAEFGAQVKRPTNSALSTERFEQLTQSSMPGWEDALRRYLSERGKCAEHHNAGASAPHKNA